MSSPTNQISTQSCLSTLTSPYYLIWVLSMYSPPNLRSKLTSRTWDSRNKMALMVLDNILAALKDEPLPDIVPEHR
jgi:hypothetical protein